MRVAAPRLIARALLTLVGAAPLLAGGDDPAEISLRRAAETSQPHVTVFDVVVIRSADEELLRKLHAARLGPVRAGATARFSHEQVIAAMSAAGVNVANVMMAGGLECEVRSTAQATSDERVRLTASEKRTPVTRPASSADAPMVEALSRDASGIEVEPQAEQTLAELLRARVQSDYESQGGLVELEFEQAGREYLELTSPEYSFDITGGRSGAGGGREFHVGVRKDGVTQRSTKIFARVLVTWPVVIAKTALSLGSYVRPQDLTIEKRRFADGLDHGFATIEPLLGQRLKTFVAQGKMLEPADLRQEPLVQRSRPVTVLSDEGGVTVRMSGVALDNGLLNDTVRVRVGPDRGKRRELRGVVTGVGGVKLTGE